MKHETGRRWRWIAALGSVGATFAFACAGSDIPPTTSELRDELATAFSGSAAGTGGRGGSGGSAGSANAGQSGSGNEAGAAGSGGGSAGAAGAGGADVGGAAGSGGAEGGAAGTGGAGGGEPCDGFEVLQANCGQSACHGTPGPFGNFAATLEDAQSFVGEEGPTTCNGYGPIFDPANPEDSILVQKLTGDAECGGQMPQGADPLEQADIDCVVEWIGTLE